MKGQIKGYKGTDENMQCRGMQFEVGKAVYKDEYTLDYIGDVLIMKGKILFTIPCEW